MSSVTSPTKHIAAQAGIQVKQRMRNLIRTSLLGIATLTIAAGPAWALDTLLSKDAEAILNKRLMKFPTLLNERALPADHVPSPRDEFEKAYDLYIRYTQGTIYNPTTKKYDRVNLRAYQQRTDTGWDAEKDDSGRFQAPAMVIDPGQTARFRLYNQLPLQILPGEPPPSVPYVVCPPTAMNAPLPFSCFNVTNLHGHGLWVSPSGNSDNVLLSIDPAVNFEYEYNVPVDHPAGTFWYHTHVHGTTAMQVGSGMTGALVIYGDRPPTVSANGDLDTLLRDISPKATTVNQIMMFQQIPYACKVTGSSITDWSCTESEIGVVENFKQVGPGSVWKNSGRYTSINGQIQPTVPLTSKRVHRWRLIDAGFQSTLTFGIKKVSNQAALEKYLLDKGGTLNMETVCGGFDIVQFEVASDGLTHHRIISKTQNYLQPGYRSDILFTLPEDGYYCVYDNKSVDNLNNNAKETRLLAVIRAANPDTSLTLGTSAADQTAYLQSQLILAARTVYRPGPVQTQVIADLNDNLKLSKFTPHKPITNAEIAESGLKELPVRFGFGADGNQFEINGKAYDGTISHQLLLGRAQKWILSSESGSHPHHIHINPFEIVKITNKNGSPVIDPQYKDMVGTWRDTVMVTQDVEIEIRTRYERYIGEFVLHCHILGHEDQGMMQAIKVVLPNSKGQAPAPHMH